MIPTPQTIFFALSGGFLPALLWLWFWLHEDRAHPEPRGMIIGTFLAGMVAVPLVLPLEQIIESHFASQVFLMVFLWATIEETFKWGAAYFSALETKEYDEPVDAIIYMVTAALGFAAMENTLFLISAITDGGMGSSFVTGNLRFIGASLLHVLASGILGFFIAETFKKSLLNKQLCFFAGLAIAVLLHTTFNLYIMKSQGTSIFAIFALVWVAILFLIAGFEKVKQIKKR
ncbi:MAG: PrsW family glutamic-type intramembrane protease [Patescibacteria group bacterium]